MYSLSTLAILALAAAFLWHSRDHIVPFLQSASIVVIMRVLSLGMLAVYVSTVILYGMNGLYFDHIEPSVAAIGARTVYYGAPAYSDWSTGEVYTLPYGQLLYWIEGIALQGGLGATKFACSAALLGGVAFLYRAVQKASSDALPGVLVAALAIIQLVPFQMEAFWTRAEPFLYLTAGVSIWVAISLRARPLRAMVVLGVVAGVAAGVKISGPLYIVPAGLLALCQAATLKERGLCVMAGGIVSLAVFAFPALLDPSLFEVLPAQMALTAKHGFSTALVIENARYAGGLLLPLLIVLALRWPAFSKSDMWTIAGLGIALAGVMVAGSKDGAGPHHVIPLAPAVLYLTARGMAAPARGPMQWRADNFFAVLMFGLFITEGDRLTRLLDSIPAPFELDEAKRAEFLGLLAAHPQAEVGVGSEGSYKDTYLRPLQVMQNGRYHLDIPAWMEIQHMGVPETPLLALLQTCAVPDWLLPAGPPFSMTNWYNGRPLFSAEFQRTFADRYRMVAQGKFYSVWRCQQPS